ncbi:amino acid ABC transporter substrate-binding protein, PAAT family [Seinonella peptonophila]|uniref:Amino acid ABC transporter substrate-binding protein, PAAT family n=1 Tax=Seinonella peptonophila TaxID=112248 RepID=A0A1M4SMK6_9BACL|nr:ABC transporter substrate-binding protein [Seinonella peptonophila]SHE33382.1 amino acid ABC transporter substrate-binding protein, PAAT family [Seinonella peptonophila]
MKKFLIAILAVVSIVALTACGGGQTGGSSGQTLKVASTPTGPPYTFLNTETNKIDGIMVDIVNELGKRIGQKIEIKPMQFSTLISSVKERKVDAIAAGMIMTDERKKEVAFTKPVFGFGEGLVVQKGDNKTKTIDDLKGKVVGVQLGTTYKDFVEKKGVAKELKVYKAIGEMLKDLDNKRLDAVIADGPVITYLKQQNPNFKIQVVEEYKPSVVGETGIGLAKGNTKLLEKLNKAIDEMKKDGSFQQIYKKWGVKWE